MKSAPIFDRAVEMIQDRLDLISVSHRLTSGNLANATTPRYVAKELAFQKTLQESMQDQQVKLTTSRSAHIALEGSVVAAAGAEVRDEGPVNVEQEMMKLVRNNVDYQFMVAMLNKKFAMLKNAVTEGTA
ncbi:MAG TPA: flagellar basal body rod protein FlgB [Syntrophobacteraceae bacterium]|nr:flagellar basal body rod protein FlgB [Syntrophobacteraceae bacterium]